MYNTFKYVINFVEMVTVIRQKKRVETFSMNFWTIVDFEESNTIGRWVNRNSAFMS